jgi:hypothetical protein
MRPGPSSRRCQEQAALRPFDPQDRFFGERVGASVVSGKFERRNTPASASHSARISKTLREAAIPQPFGSPSNFLVR